MNVKKFQEAYQKLRLLDERLTYRVRPRPGTGLGPPTAEQTNEKLRDLADYTVQLKEVVEELFLAIAAKPENGSD